ncbi:MAG TPA: hypothetical protein VGN12_11175 [Pirellulales bacterium]|jgi:hypothetical protein
MVDTAPTTRRRWFQFGVGTALATLMVTAWITREVKLVYERHAALSWLKENGIGVMTVAHAYQSAGHWGGGYVPPSIPWWRRVLGDEPIPSLIFPAGNSSDEDALKARCSRLFPEAEIYDPDEH